MNSVNLSASNLLQLEGSQTQKSRKSTKAQLHYIQHKAGMDNMDAQEIARKVYEASKDSDYYKKQLFRTERAKQKGK